MKRSVINDLVRSAGKCFERRGWTLPPDPRWDVTDFGLGDILHFGLVLVNLAEEPEYCEKLMYARRGMKTPAHSHKIKKEDIVCRAGSLQIILWNQRDLKNGETVKLKINGKIGAVQSGEALHLRAGERVTLLPGLYHEFFPSSDECIIGEVSTANDDLNDNFFVNSDIGRFPGVEEDEPVLMKLISDRA